MFHNTWKLVKYPNDMFIYAVCTKCGYKHEVSKFNSCVDGWEPPHEGDPRRMPRYCPVCGRKKKFYDPNVISAAALPEIGHPWWKRKNRKTYLVCRIADPNIGGRIVFKTPDEAITYLQRFAQQ